MRVLFENLERIHLHFGVSWLRRASAKPASEFGPKELRRSPSKAIACEEFDLAARKRDPRAS